MRDGTCLETQGVMSCTPYIFLSAHSYGEEKSFQSLQAIGPLRSKCKYSKDGAFCPPSPFISSHPMDFSLPNYFSLHRRVREPTSASRSWAFVEKAPQTPNQSNSLPQSHGHQLALWLLHGFPCQRQARLNSHTTACRASWAMGQTQKKHTQAKIAFLGPWKTISW